MNTYGYVDANPINFVDPLGLVRMDDPRFGLPDWAQNAEESVPTHISIDLGQARFNIGMASLSYQPIAPWSFGASYNICNKGNEQLFDQSSSASDSECSKKDNVRLNDTGIESSRAGIGISRNAFGDKCIFIGVGVSSPANVTGPSIRLSGG